MMEMVLDSANYWGSWRIHRKVIVNIDLYNKQPPVMCQSARSGFEFDTWNSF